ncbi:MAG: hypothetical protein ACYTXC_27520 [Nostoc sp.]
MKLSSYGKIFSDNQFPQRPSLMSFDNLCKLLSEKHPVTFASWVLGTPQTAATVLKTYFGRV